jgi:hypothetical protein
MIAVSNAGIRMEVRSLTIHGLLLRTNSQPGLPQWLHCGSSLYPKASQDGQLAQSLSPMAPWFVPLHLFLLTMRPHFSLAKVYVIAGRPRILYRM